MRLCDILVPAALALWATAARAQPADSSTLPSDRPADATVLPAPAASLPASPQTLPDSPELRLHDARLRSQILQQAEREADAKIKKAKDELHDELRAELVTAGAQPGEFEQLPAEKPKLQLLDIDGYFRLRPTLFENLWLGWTQPDPLGYYLFPKPYVNTTGKTITSTDMRFRVEPTLNVSEDIRVRSQIDVFDNLVLGSTPAGPYGDLSIGSPDYYSRAPSTVFSKSQMAPVAAGDVFRDSLVAKRAWAEVTTPVGQLRFGRMGSQWGLGMYQNDGNCIDCDYGNTVDRAMFIAKVANHYIIPMIDFVGSGPLYNPYANDPLGQPVAFDHALQAYEYVLTIARKDTDEELHKSVEEGKSSLNYGFYGVYRTMDHEAVGYGDNPSSLQGFYGQVPPPNGPSALAVPPGVIQARNASFFTPDLWFRYQTKRLRIEAEATYVYGSFDTFWDPSNPADSSHLITVNEYGGVVQTEYHLLADGALSLGMEGGVASGDTGPGFGNHPDRTAIDPKTGAPIATPPGSIDGRQYSCNVGTAPCPDSAITNFSFNRDYHVDMILWREILGGVTDAYYAKPTVKYLITEGLEVSLSLIYSQAMFASSTPGGHTPLGLEGDTGIHYATDDGFMANLDYGVLLPFSGLGEATPTGFVSPSIAQAIRMLLGIKF